MARQCFITEEQFSRIISSNIRDIEDPVEVKKYAQEVWDILTTAYADKGGFFSFRNLKDMLKKNATFSIITDSNDSVNACAVYNDYLGGYKLVGCGAKENTIENKIFLKEIIKRDINDYSSWHWAEVSPPLEYWFKKYNGYAIPNIYANDIINKDNLILSDDGIHYKRNIGKDSIPADKVIYGFKDDATFKKVTTEYIDYDGFRRYANMIKESLTKAETDMLEYYKSIIIGIINRWDENFSELTKLHFELLKTAVQFLERENIQDRQIKTLISTGHYLLDNIEILHIGGSINVEQIANTMVENIFSNSNIK